MDKETSEVIQNSNIFYAPSIHTGGGLVLLKEILNTKNFANNWKHIYLDERVKTKLNLSNSIKNIIFVKSRLLAEWQLRQNCKTGDTVLCFHGLPPLFLIKGKVVVFLQNRILLEPLKNNNYSITILLKKIWLRLSSRANVIPSSKINRTRAIFHRTRVLTYKNRLRALANQIPLVQFNLGIGIRYIVQTPAMLNSAMEFLGKNIDITILPFAPQNNPIQKKNLDLKKFDFIYPASGELHKNHLNLLKAWKILADINIKPSLALTVNAGLYPELLKKIQKYQLDIVNLGEIPLVEVLDLYTKVSAVIYPSKSESFGLPLIEATTFKLPIIASELDYVRDVANPVETFDPNSSTSIARAVRRFLNKSESLITINSAEEFLKKVI